MGAISDMVIMGDLNRVRAWMLAIAVATLGGQLLHQFAVVDLGGSIYLAPNLGLGGAVIGGLMFGFGMTLAGGCVYKTLVRLGGGNLKSLFVAVLIGIFAYMTLRGLIGPLRLAIEGATSLDLEGAGFETQGLPDLLAGLTGLAADGLRWTLTLLLAGALVWFCFRSPAFRASPRDIIAGLLVGLMVAAGWLVTGVIGYDDFDPTPLASLSFVAPVGQGLVYLMTFTGASINFGIAAVGGVIAGAFLAARATGGFRVESFTGAGDMLRHIVGAALMGVGGVMALGCTVGQGITGVSTLALGSLIALASIVAGGVYGIRYLEEGSLRGALRAMLARG